MTSQFLSFNIIPAIGFLLLGLNLLLAPHNPYKEKKTPFECGYHSFLTQNRTQFTISFFIFGLLFLLFDLEIVLIYPYTMSSSFNNLYGLVVVIIFILNLSVGFIFELGKKALKIDTLQEKNSLQEQHNILISGIFSNIYSAIAERKDLIYTTIVKPLKTIIMIMFSCAVIYFGLILNLDFSVEHCHGPKMTAAPTLVQLLDSGEIPRKPLSNTNDIIENMIPGVYETTGGTVRIGPIGSGYVNKVLYIKVNGDEGVTEFVPGTQPFNRNLGCILYELKRINVTSIGPRGLNSSAYENVFNTYRLHIGVTPGAPGGTHPINNGLINRISV